MWCRCLSLPAMADDGTVISFIGFFLEKILSPDAPGAGSRSKGYFAGSRKMFCALKLPSPCFFAGIRTCCPG